MCGRYVIKTAGEELARLLGAMTDGSNAPPRYNVAPTQTVPACRLDEQGRRQMVALRWGLVPAWSRDASGGAYRLINARAETVASKPSFRGAFRARRCLLPADGYYEWQVDGTRKQPWYIHARDGLPLVFAGLWEHWQGADGSSVTSCAIVTTAAGTDIATVHDRMPALLDADGRALWLAPHGDRASLQALLRPAPAATLQAHPVSTAVNDARHDAADCIEPLARA